MRYSKQYPCPKCGEKDIFDRFRAKGDLLDDTIGCVFERALEDLIRRYCRNCTYTWNEISHT